jgi:apolipoprotein N-acyltransferase
MCYDMDFPGLVRQVSNESGDLLLVPVAEPEPPANVRRTHHQMATCRANENGLSLVRAYRLGLSSEVDPYGRILGLRDDAKAKQRAMVAQVPTTGERTIYARIGNLFGWLCAAGFAGSIMWAILG